MTKMLIVFASLTMVQAAFADENSNCVASLHQALDAVPSTWVIQKGVSAQGQPCTLTVLENKLNGSAAMTISLETLDAKTLRPIEAVTFLEGKNAGYSVESCGATQGAFAAQWSAVNGFGTLKYAIKIDFDMIIDRIELSSDGKTLVCRNMRPAR